MTALLRSRGCDDRAQARSAVVGWGLERGPRSQIWAWVAVRGHRFEPGAQSAVVNLGLGHGPRSLS